MAIRSFIFCDICNPQAIRYVEQRRGPRGDGTNGRRLTDGRSWFDGTEAAAAAEGWTVADGHHVCPRCQKRQLHQR